MRFRPFRRSNYGLFRAKPFSIFEKSVAADLRRDFSLRKSIYRGPCPITCRLAVTTRRGADEPDCPFQAGEARGGLADGGMQYLGVNASEGPSVRV